MAFERFKIGQKPVGGKQDDGFNANINKGNPVGGGASSDWLSTLDTNAFMKEYRRQAQAGAGSNGMNFNNRLLFWHLLGGPATQGNGTNKPPAKPPTNPGGGGGAGSGAKPPNPQAVNPYDVPRPTQPANNPWFVSLPSQNWMIQPTSPWAGLYY